MDINEVIAEARLDELIARYVTSETFEEVVSPDYIAERLREFASEVLSLEVQPALKDRGLGHLSQCTPQVCHPDCPSRLSLPRGEGAVSTEKIIEQYGELLGPKPFVAGGTAAILTEIILIAKIEETGYFGDFIRRVGTGWAFGDSQHGVAHTTWDLEATLEEARPRNLPSAEIDNGVHHNPGVYAAADVTPPHERTQVTVAKPEPFVCQARIFSGPGHQSASKCTRMVPHPLEGEHYVEEITESWTGPKGFARQP